MKTESSSEKHASPVGILSCLERASGACGSFFAFLDTSIITIFCLFITMISLFFSLNRCFTSSIYRFSMGFYDIFFNAGAQRGKVKIILYGLY
jgi:hypothetical protein